MVGSDANIKSPIPGPARGGLAPRQVKRACERIESDLSGKVSIARDRGRVWPLGQPILGVSDFYWSAAIPVATWAAHERG